MSALKTYQVTKLDSYDVNTGLEIGDLVIPKNAEYQRLLDAGCLATVSVWGKLPKSNEPHHKFRVDASQLRRIPTPTLEPIVKTQDTLMRDASNAAATWLTTEAPNRRDCYVTAALTGLLASGSCMGRTAASTAKLAVHFADATLRQLDASKGGASS